MGRLGKALRTISDLESTERINLPTWPFTDESPELPGLPAIIRPYQTGHQADTDCSSDSPGKAL